MKRIVPILALATAATLAGRPDTPLTTSATVRPAVRSVAPVAVMRVTSKKPIPGGKWRYWFSGSTSYDPDGTISSYYWYPDAYCRLDGAYGTTYYMDIPDGESCGLTLTGTDNSRDTDSDIQYFTGGL